MPMALTATLHAGGLPFRDHFEPSAVSARPTDIRGDCMAFRDIVRISHFVLLVGLGACESFSLTPPQPAQIRSEAGAVVNDREIVALTDNQTIADALVRRSSALGYKLVRRDDLGSLDLVQVVLDIPEGRNGPAAIQELESLVSGVTAGVNHAYRPQQDGSEPRRFAAAQVNWPATTCDARQPIGVIDTPIDPAHTVFSGVTIRERRFADGAAAAHGFGVAVPFTASNMLERPNLFWAAAVDTSPGIEQAAGVDVIVRALGWLHEENIRLVNISLAGPYNKILDRAVQRAADRGMLIIAAAGNDGPSASPRYPAALPDVIAVTAVDAAASPYAKAVQGSHIDVAAPGVDIFVPYQERYVSGTSLAAPYVTAYFAALGQTPPSVKEAKTLLARHARDLGPKGHDQIYGWGLLNARHAC